VTRLFPIGSAALLALLLAAPLDAQTARAVGTIRDTNGRAIKGATIRAINKDAYPPEIASTSDDKGRWAMIGLRIGNWTFVAEAPGYFRLEAQSFVRTGAAPPMAFTLARDPGPIPGALDRNIQQQLSAANALRDQGQLDQALAAYQDIRAKNPKLTAVNLVVAGVYRKKAGLESDPAARRQLLDRAIDSYTEVLKSDATNTRAQAELEATRSEAAAPPR
jgi:hypothetical protein